jgi:hypothetical protein
MNKSPLAKIVESIKPLKRVKRMVNGKSYHVHYIDDRILRNHGLTLLGYTYKRKIYIRQGLPRLVERGLLRHEIYHVEDSHNWLGKYGRELRANVYTILHDPIGFLADLIYSLNYHRFKTYWRLYVWPRNLH